VSVKGGDVLIAIKSHLNFYRVPHQNNNMEQLEAKYYQ